MAGYHEFNNDAVAHAQLLHEQADTISFGRYLTSSEFGQAVMENWQSEYLQFSLFILGTIWLLQRGSPESKELDKAGLESDRSRRSASTPTRDSPRWARVGGLRTFIYSNSLLLVMTAIFLGSWFAHSVTGWSAYNAEQVEHQQPELSWVQLPRQRRLLADDPPELAVGVPRRRLDGDPVRLPAPARLTGVEAGGRPPRRDRRRGLGSGMRPRAAARRRRRSSVRALFLRARDQLRRGRCRRAAGPRRSSRSAPPTAPACR